MGWRQLTLATAAISALASAASAQALGGLEQPPEYARGRNTAVRERPQPGWDPVGIRVSAFEVYPEVSVASAFTTNAKKAQDDEESELYWRVRPAARIFSTWSRHGVGLNLWAAREIHSEFSEDNATEYSATGIGRLDVRRDLALDTKATHARLVLSRATGEVPVDTTKPVYFDQDAVSIRAIYTLPRIQLAVQGSFLSEDFDNTPGAGRVINFSTRDREIVSYGGRATYAVSPDFAVFGAVLRAEADRPSVVTADLGYTATTLMAGANFDLTNLARGEVALGYLDQKYDRTSADADAGLAVNAEVQWFATQMTTVSLAGSRRSAPQLDAQSPGGITTSASGAIDHELLRNLIVSARASYAETDYAFIRRDDEQKRAGLAVTYKLSRALRVDLAYDLTKLESRGRDRQRSFDDQTVSLVLYAFR